MMIRNISLLFAILMITVSCKTPKVQTSPEVYSYNADTTGSKISIEFTRGAEFNHPLLAIWVEDEQGKFVQTLYISQSIGKGVFEHGDASTGHWQPGPIMRPAALPYWAHRRGIMNSNGSFLPDSENPIPDAYTGASPKGDFIINTRIEDASKRKFSVYLEINQTWDWNEFWTNAKYPDDDEYKTSCQPALVYMADVNLDGDSKIFEMKAIGHSHYSGKTGELFTDLSTITTALNIVKDCKVIVK